MKRARRILSVLTVLAVLLAANLALGQPVAQACLGGDGRGGIYEGPFYDSDCTANETCRSAWCMCGGDTADWACTPLRLCAGQCMEN